MEKPCHFIRKVKEFFNNTSHLLIDVYKVLQNKYSVECLLENDKNVLMSRITFVQSHESQMREAVL